MSVAKVMEITAESDKSFEDAVGQGVARASKTVQGVRNAWVKDAEVKVDGGKISTYRVTLKLTFVLND